MEFNPQLVDIGLALLLNILTQIGKKFHVEPFTVFKIMALGVSLAYAVIAFLGYEEAVGSVIASIITIVGLASGFWHLIMRPDGEVVKWLRARGWIK